MICISTDNHSCNRKCAKRRQSQPMLLILEAFRYDVKQGIEGAGFVLKSGLFCSFASRKAKDFCVKCKRFFTSVKLFTLMHNLFLPKLSTCCFSFQIL